jgi:hypothetical protein
LLFPDFDGDVVSDLPSIAAELRSRLTDDVESGEFDERAALVLEKFVSGLSIAERAALPRKKRRALEEMAIVLKKFRANAAERQDQSAVDHYGELLDMLNPDSNSTQPNWDEVASLWLEIIRPLWYRQLKTKRRRPLLLKDIRHEVIAAEDQLRSQIMERFDDLEQLQNSDERISACIIGV